MRKRAGKYGEMRLCGKMRGKKCGKMRKIYPLSLSNRGDCCAQWNLRRPWVPPRGGEGGPAKPKPPVLPKGPPAPPILQQPPGHSSRRRWRSRPTPTSRWLRGGNQMHQMHDRIRKRGTGRLKRGPNCILSNWSK